MAVPPPVSVRIAKEHHDLIREIAAALKRDPAVAERIRACLPDLPVRQAGRQAVLYTATSGDAVNRPFTPLPGRALAPVEDRPEAEPDAVYERLATLEDAFTQLARPSLPLVR